MSKFQRLAKTAKNEVIEKTNANNGTVSKQLYAELSELKDTDSDILCTKRLQCP